MYYITLILFVSTQYLVKIYTMFNDEKVVEIEEQVVNRLRKFREERKMSQLELSLASDVSQNMITYIETGKRVPSLRTIIKLCIALEISPANLFELVDEDRVAAKKMVLEAIQRFM